MNRKVLSLIIIILVVLGVGATGFAAPEDAAKPQDTAPMASGSSEPTSTPMPTDILTINSGYVDGDMNTSYQNGYSPIMRNSQAIIVLPLQIKTSELAANSDMRATVGLSMGDPFVANNYETTIPWASFGGGEYILKYQIPLTWPRTNGTHPVTITITYTLKDGTVTSQSFPINVVVTDGPVPTPEPTETPTPSEGPVSQPKVILSSYTVSPDPVYAGEIFTVTGTLQNTSKNMNVSNLTINHVGETTDLMPEDGASTSFIESIAPGETSQFSFKMEARADAKAGPQKIAVSMSYEDSKATKYDVTDEIMVQVRQHIRLNTDPPKFPSSAYIGDSIQTSLNLYNKGKNILYNVTVDLVMEGLTPESSAFLGNMDSGVSKTADIYAMVGGATDDPEPIQAGHYTGVFIISYEDEYGDTYDMEVPVELEIMDMSMDMGMMEGDMMGDAMMEEVPRPGLPWWAWVLIVAIAAIVVIAILVNHRKKKRERELLEEMDDDDIS